MMAERGLTIDHSTIARWVLRYAPALNQRIDPKCGIRTARGGSTKPRPALRVGGHIFFRAIDSAGNTIDMLLSPYRDTLAAKSFLQLALAASRADAIPVYQHQWHPAYRAAVEQLKDSGELDRNCQCRGSVCINNMVEQDHRFVKKRAVASQGFRSVATATA